MTAEQIRSRSHCTRILQLLRRRPRTNGELAQVTHRFGGRLMELRKRGHDIQTDWVDRRKGIVRYRLGR